MPHPVHHYSARSYSFSQYWIYFMARFDVVRAFAYNSAYNSTGSEPIWMKFGAIRVHCLPLALADFGRDRRRSERSTRNFVFFVT